MKDFGYTSLKPLYVAMLALSVPYGAYAQEVTHDEPSVELEQIEIFIKNRLTKKTQETTGLGKTVKTQETLAKQQVLSIKDLVKDVPGVAVVEQGRGASQGFSIRGMDKNRVAVSVDGINQIQSYLVQKRQFGDGREGSGAINEIELENLSGVQISQGASASESGSGALGGAVSFYTKSASDVLEDGKNHSLYYKGAYTSKDSQRLHSFGAVFKHGDTDFLTQYTKRTKQEIKPHKDIYHTQYQLHRLGGYAQDFQAGLMALDDDPKRTFVLAQECASYMQGVGASVADCLKPKLKITPISEMVDAKSYTGDKRVLPDPMDYHSDSYLIKAGHQINHRHRLEGVLEHTTQRYNSRDMTKPAYHINPEHGQGSLASSSLLYRGNNYSEGFNSSAVNEIGNTGIGMWTQSQFFDEKHQKQRYGIQYIYKNDDGKGWLDGFKFGFDDQQVGIDHLQVEKYCSPYPVADRHCQAGFDKPNSAERQNRKHYQEDHRLWRAEFNKTFGDKIQHQLHAQAGIDKFRSNLWIGDIRERYYHTVFDFKEDLKVPLGEFTEVYDVKQQRIESDICQNANQYLAEARKCGNRPITGRNIYTALKNTSHIGDIASISVGVRQDHHRFDSNDDWTGTGKYRNVSWHTGIVVRPTDFLDVAYRASSGYRVPSFKELFGYRMDGNIKGQDDRHHYRTDVRPEKALNQEIGLTFRGDFGTLEASYFDNRYRDLIDLTLKNDQWGYRNYQNVHLTGFGFAGKVPLDGLWQKIPAGLTFRASYLQTDVKNSQIKEGFQYGTGYFLDSISPARYVVGLEYLSFDDRWGADATWTFTKAKDNSELSAIVVTPAGEYQKVATPLSTQSWRTLDLTAFYRLGKHLTLRAGAYNILNHRYSTWEAVRQTSVVSGNQHTLGLPSQYASAGRNYSLALEMKF